MDLDQEVCLCFHVTRRKIESFIRHERPKRASQLSECYGAGTGCKWCVRYLKAIFDANSANREPTDSDSNSSQHAQEDTLLPSPQRYAQMRRSYRQSLKNQPSGAARKSDIDDMDAQIPGHNE